LIFIGVLLGVLVVVGSGAEGVRRLATEIWQVNLPMSSGRAKTLKENAAWLSSHAAFLKF
jgi:hypothetical protein